MNDTASPTQAHSRFAFDPRTLSLLGGAAILAIGMALGGYLLGDGIPRAKEAERAVTVRGLAEREVTADLATWTISYSTTSTDLGAAQAKVSQDRAALEAFFAELGFPADALQPTGANVSSYTDDGVTRYTVRERLALRTSDIEKAQQAVARQFDIVRRGVLIEEGSGMSYTFTKLNDIKPEMVAEATRDARAAADSSPKTAAPMLDRSRKPRRAISRSTRATATAAAAGARRTPPTRRCGSSRR
ncbi:hypothetical protein GCM10010923_05100 [Blastomonas marina]|uniref:SIMPL domain-containing protein n=1 Tax=Blastomonas marina TaxID=1867408 RepID=A0ABQ1F546_9SPHN|nr:hypothetical protein GCM10010923_05100 [Blastomonas marina]